MSSLEYWMKAANRNAKQRDELMAMLRSIVNAGLLSWSETDDDQRYVEIAKSTIEQARALIKALT